MQPAEAISFEGNVSCVVVSVCVKPKRKNRTEKYVTQNPLTEDSAIHV